MAESVWKRPHVALWMKDVGKVAALAAAWGAGAYGVTVDREVDVYHADGGTEDRWQFRGEDVRNRFRAS